MTVRDNKRPRRQLAHSGVWHRGNFAPGREPLLYGNFLQVPDDSIVSIESLLDGGIIAISGTANDEDAILVWVKTVGVALCKSLVQLSAEWAVGTGTPNGSTGVDGNTTIFADSTLGRIHIENRQGGPRNYAWSLITHARVV